MSISAGFLFYDVLVLELSTETLSCQVFCSLFIVEDKGAVLQLHLDILMYMSAICG